MKIFFKELLFSTLLLSMPVTAQETPADSEKEESQKVESNTSNQLVQNYTPLLLPNPCKINPNLSWCKRKRPRPKTH